MLSRHMAIDFIYFSLYLEFMKLELCFYYTFCKGEKRALQLKFMKMELENMHTTPLQFGIQLQV